MIIFGVRKYDRRDCAYARAFCENCGRPVYLRSYTAWSWYHLYWVPLIPLGKKRIVGHCPECDVGREMSLREWKYLRQDLEPTLKSARDGSIPREGVLKVIDALLEVGDEKDFAPVAASALRRFPDDPEILRVLGAGFDYFGMPEEAGKALRRSYRIEENEDLHQYLNDREHLPSAAPPEPPNRASQLAPLLIVPSLAAAAILIAIVTNISARLDRVYLVNGLDREYQVTVNGEASTLPAHGRIKLEVGYGELRVDAADGEGVQPEPFSTHLKASVMDRLGDGPLFVLNPDRTAVLLWEQLVYVNETVRSSVDVEGRHELYVGDPFYSFDNVDADFENLPEEIEMSTSATTERRSQLTQLTEVEPDHLIAALIEDAKLESALQYAIQRLRFEPENEMLLVFATRELEPEAALEFLETGRTARPLRINWHRYYQNVAELVTPASELISQYRQLHEAEPDNPDMTYLLGRIVEDPDEALALFVDASEGAEPSAYAFHALAYHWAIRGSFEKALGYERKARALNPEVLSFIAMEENLLLATRRYDELIDRRLLEISDSGLSLRRAMALLFTYGWAGRAAAATDFVQEMVAGVSPEDVDRTSVATLQAAFEEGARNVAAYAEECDKVGIPEWRYRAAVARGDYERAAFLLDSLESRYYESNLLLYTLARQSGKQELARTRLDQALRQLHDGSHHDRAVAAWFETGASPPSMDDLYRVDRSIEGLVVMMAALGVYHEQAKLLFFEEARKLNFDPTFPGLILDAILK